MSEASKHDPILDGDGEGEIDPFHTRELLRWRDREKGKKRGAMNWRDFDEWLAKLRISERDRHATVANSLACLFQAVKSGEFDLTDEEGRDRNGDLKIEVADYLYDSNREVERGAQAG